MEAACRGEKVVLHKAEKPWMAQRKDKEGADPAEAQTQELYRKFQGILNKLTPQKFQALAEQALKLEINTEERLSGCIDKIFTRALEEPMYSIAYANLCKVMSPIKVEYISEEGKTKQTNFRRMLLTKCQREYEKDKKDNEILETMQKEIENAKMDEKRAALKEEMEMTMTRMRKRSLGNIRFMGELFELWMLSEVIMHECITRLLKSTSDKESLECFARLITTTGKELDREAAKGRMDVYFKRINDIIKKGKVPARVRFMLQDVIELRENSWVSQVRHDQQLKTIDQIHAEAAIEQAKEKEMVQQHQVISKGGAGRRDNRRGSKDDHMIKERERRREREKFEPSKLNKLMSRKDKGSSGQGQLAPSGFLRPAAGWKKTGAQPSDGAKSKILPRSSTGPGSNSKADNRAGSRAPTMPGPRHSHTTPESEKESLLQAVNKFITSEVPESSAPTSQPPYRDMPQYKQLPWRPHSKVKVSGKEAQQLKVCRKFQGILNKLTPQKFQILAEQALALNISTKEMLIKIVNMLYTKAVTEPIFTVVYANLSKVMSLIVVEKNSFRKIFLTKCQTEFEKEESEEAMQETENQMTMNISAMNRRKCYLGNIQLLGELYNLQMLSDSIICSCISHVLKSPSKEERLEYFCKLLTIIGKKLDRVAQDHLDTYFEVIGDVLAEGKMCSRVKFLLMDVIELRERQWQPRLRQLTVLKTVTQIHKEAAIEEAEEKEMLYYYNTAQRARTKHGYTSRDDQMRDLKREREKFDHSKLNKLIGNRKDKGSKGNSQVPRTGFRRPAGGWKKGGASPTLDEAKSLKAPSRSSVSQECKTGSHAGSMSRLDQAANTATKASESRNVPSKNLSGQVMECSEKRADLSLPMSEESILFVQRKITSAIDKLVNSKDYKAAIECVKEIDLPGAMKQVVVESINHTLERKAVYRPVTGQLLSRLVQEKVVSQHDFSDGLSEVLEVAEDMCIDIPKIWDYLGEVLCPVFAHGHIHLSVFKSSPPSLLESGWVSILVAKLLSHCRSVLKGEEEVKGLWSKCGLQWEDLGVHRDDLEEFLDRRDLSFLLVGKFPASKDLPQPLLDSFHSLVMDTDSTTNDVNNWIKQNCAGQDYDPALLVTNLTSAIVQASVSGTGDHAILNPDLFERRIEVVKTQGHYGVAVLHGLQYSVAKLSYPHKLLHDLFNSVYDLDLVDEQEFYTWRDDDQVMYGKGTAVASVKPFFDWLKADKSLEQI